MAQDDFPLDVRLSKLDWLDCSPAISGAVGGCMIRAENSSKRSYF